MGVIGSFKAIYKGSFKGILGSFKGILGSVKGVYMGSFKGIHYKGSCKGSIRVPLKGSYQGFIRVTSRVP